MKQPKRIQPRDLPHQPAALLVIDVQQGLFEHTTPIYHADQLLANINRLADRAHQAGIPVVYVRHCDKRALIQGSPDWQLHMQLHPSPEDLLVEKQHGNAFEDTTLAQELRARRVTRVVVTGLVTHGCVRATCLGAHALGYEVVLVADAHSSYSNRAAELIEEWNQKLGAETAEVLTTAEIDFQH